jgi:hypothetical protein
MAADSTTYVAKYLRAIEAFNDGNVETFGDLLADDCTFDGTAGRFGTSRDEIVKGLQEGRDAGWLSHDPIGTAAAGEFLVTVYENKFSDGSRVTAAGCLRFNDDARSPRSAASTPASEFRAADNGERRREHRPRVRTSSNADPRQRARPVARAPSVSESLGIAQRAGRQPGSRPVAAIIWSTTGASAPASAGSLYRSGLTARTVGTSARATWST